MERKTSSKIMSGILTALALLLLAILPIGVQLLPEKLEDQAVAPTTEVITVTQDDVAQAVIPQVEVAQTEVAEIAASESEVAQTEVSAEAQVIEYTLRTLVGGDPMMAYVGVGGDIDGIVNPTLEANVGDTVRITVVNGDPVLHDLVIDEFGAHSEHLTEKEQTSTIEFVVTQPGEFEYYCSIPGHREIGMKGLLRVTGTANESVAASDEIQLDESAATSHVNAHNGDSNAVNAQNASQNVNVAAAAPAIADATSIVRNPADMPGPVGNRGPQHIRLDMTTKEVNGTLADGTTYRYMTFDGQVPGPMIRVRVGDTIELHLRNAEDSQLPHSIDLHAVTGPGGGAVFTQIMPGEEGSFTFQALQPGLYVYHCATASIAHHIASGMYGLILVEPEGGLPPVDHEFYVMQGELYTEQPYGTQGHVDYSTEKALDEDAEYFMFNGAAGALTLDEYAMRAEVGDTVRIYFGVGGPNAISSFHVIGEIFDRVYQDGSLTSPPLEDVQTTLVAPGGATVVDFKLDVPGRYILVDHALSRAERGLAGYLYAEGEENPAIFEGHGDPNTAGH